MNVDQSIRRWVNRTRRRIIGGADHEPLVEVEPTGALLRQTPPPPRQRPLRAKAGPAKPKKAAPKRRSGLTMGRMIRGGLGFAVTLMALALGYVALMSTATRIPPDWSLVAAPTEGDGAAWAALAGEALRPAPNAGAGADHELLFLPNRGQERGFEFQSGAADAVLALASALAKPEPKSELAGAILAWEGAGRDREARQAALGGAHEALARLGAEKGPAPPADALSRAADLAATNLDARAAALRAEAGRSGLTPVAWGLEARFFRARGEAYGWRLMLERVARDGRALPAELTGPLPIALTALEGAADFQPVFLFSSRPNSTLAPDHLTGLAQRLEAAAAATRALSAAAMNAQR